MSEAYEAWLEGANDAVKQFTKSGIEVHRVPIEVEEFVAWARSNGMKTDGHARAEFASSKLSEKLLRPDIPAEMLPDSKQLKRIMEQLKGRDLAEVWEPYLRRPAASVCPIFRQTPAGLEQLASGTLIRIANTHFLLTAAHVTDEKRPLMVPAKKGFAQIHGLFAGSQLPDSGSRKDDRYDIAYARLEPDTVSSLHDDFLFLEQFDCDTFDEVASKDAYTMIGWPTRRANKKGNALESEIVFISGEGITDQRYEHLKCDRIHHLLVQHRRNRSVRYSTMLGTQLPLPEGMSGGVFAWSKELPKLSALVQPKLVAIVTEYHQSHNVFLATRLACYLMAIKKNEPSLPIFSIPRPDSQRNSS